ncbi:MAG: hypothetical protein JRJ08_06670 [Deltaproteobacteria bacterium]|nr:hypothetical protein [Deltaproteobacteria bacterium]
MQLKYPRIAISALRGGSGKTITSIGLIRGWLNKGITIASFKKGPDFIDAAWLREASGRPCYNLDTFLMKENTVRSRETAVFMMGWTSKEVTVPQALPNYSMCP